LDDIHLGLLIGALVALLFISACSSAAETALMTLNRYRLQHLAKGGHPGAIRAQRLLRRPDRLIGFILLVNNFANILASSLSTVVALKLFGESGIAIAAGILTLLVLIFGEVAPKTLAAMHPETIAFPASWFILPLLRIFYPVVWVVNLMANLVLRLLGFKGRLDDAHTLSKEELRTVVAEAGALIPERYLNMLLSILDLESATVEDIMVPRHEIVGIDLDDPWESVMKQIHDSRHNHLPVYQKSIDKVSGILHLRNILGPLSQQRFDRHSLRKYVEPAVFVPESTPLHRLLMHLRRENTRMALVVDEYGDVLGLVTLEDLLEEIIGEIATVTPDIQRRKDGGFLVDAGINVRELNRLAGLSLPTEGPKTLNGLIIDYLETIPEPGVSLKLFGYPLEITRMEGNAVKQVLFHPESRETRPPGADWRARSARKGPHREARP
jgi:Mg2+/Co2+ transporter CorB